MSALKVEWYKGNPDTIGFKKGNKLAEHPRAVATRFKKGQILGEKHPNWKGGISFEPYSVDWTQTLKRSIRERDHYKCQICSLEQQDRALDVHHIDYDKKNCNPSNLISLCHRCHTKTNHNRNYWLNYFNGKK